MEPPGAAVQPRGGGVPGGCWRVQPGSVPVHEPPKTQNNNRKEQNQHPMSLNVYADSVAEALAQGAGGGLDTGGPAVFRMARGQAAPLAEVLQLFQ